MPWAPDYITVEDLAPWLNDYRDDPEMNEIYEQSIGAASRLVDDWCNRQFGQVAAAEARQYPVLAGRCQIDDLMVSPTSVVGADGQAQTGFQLGPVNAPQTGRAWTSLSLAEGATDQAYVTVTAQWGWTSVPPAVKQACLMQAARFAKRKDSPFGISGSPQAQGELRLLARLDPDVQTSLTAFRRRVMPR